mmetsp:Transcript_36423/g.114186  ORF Transcript_36423/g.114186 Transcript_36423/m.114186 type:complete len:385 (+) Transcript_36423:529-1683(+)
MAACELALRPTSPWPSRSRASRSCSASMALRGLVASAMSLFCRSSSLSQADARCFCPRDLALATCLDPSALNLSTYLFTFSYFLLGISCFSSSICLLSSRMAARSRRPGVGPARVRISAKAARPCEEMPQPATRSSGGGPPRWPLAFLSWRSRRPLSTAMKPSSPSFLLWLRSRVSRRDGTRLRCFPAPRTAPLPSPRPSARAPSLPMRLCRRSTRRSAAQSGSALASAAAPSSPTSQLLRSSSSSAGSFGSARASAMTPKSPSLGLLASTSVRSFRALPLAASASAMAPAVASSILFCRRLSASTCRSARFRARCALGSAANLKPTQSKCSVLSASHLASADMIASRPSSSAAQRCNLKLSRPRACALTSLATRAQSSASPSS